MLFALFQGAVSKDVVSCAWRNVKKDWDAWRHRSLAEEDSVHLLLNGMVVKTRLDKRPLSSRCWWHWTCDGTDRKFSWRCSTWQGRVRRHGASSLKDLDARGLQQPALVTIDGAPGLETAVTALWDESLPIQHCTVHKHRNLLGHAPKRVHEELSADYRDMICSYCSDVQEQDGWLSTPLSFHPALLT